MKKNYYSATATAAKITKGPVEVIPTNWDCAIYSF